VTDSYEFMNNACQIKIYWTLKELLVSAYCGVKNSILM